MPRSGPTLEIWTEGVAPSWRAEPENRERIRRGRGRPELVLVGVQRMEQGGAAGKDCHLIVQSGARQLVITLAADHLLVSDPANLNYQNVRVAKADLTGYLREFFGQEDTSARQELNPVRVIEWIVLVIVLGTLAVALSYLSRFLKEESGFLPRPFVQAIEDRSEADRRLQRWAGLYVSRLAEGESLIEITPAGTFGYYDLERGSPSASFILRPVNSGTCQPVYDAGRLAFLTDTRFLFYPEGENQLVFLERPFTRIARERAELAGFVFP